MASLSANNTTAPYYERILSLNEFVFFHKESGTLVASDSFYGGYTEKEVPTWFARLWFKLTKGRDKKTSMFTLSELHPVFRSDSDKF